MINISKLYCDEITPGDWLRYGRKGSGERPGESVPESWLPSFNFCRKR